VIAPAEPMRVLFAGWATNPLVQNQGVGPTGIDYIDPADDPRKKE
jgi:hypothetical protein